LRQTILLRVYIKHNGLWQINKNKGVLYENQINNYIYAIDPNSQHILQQVQSTDKGMKGQQIIICRAFLSRLKPLLHLWFKVGLNKQTKPSNNI